MMTTRVLTSVEQIVENLIVDKALNAACSEVQNAFGITDGGFAQMFFMGDNGDKFRDAIKAYIKAERVWEND